MAEVNSTTNDRRRVGTRPKKHAPKTDMTPMVDLGFLLISFFVITTELNKPMATHLNMPKDGPPTPLGQSDALSVLIGKNNSLFFYHGEWTEAQKAKAIAQTSFAPNKGIGDIIREKQKWLDVHNKREGRKGLMLLIKPSPEANYSDIVDMIDQVLINKVEKYAVAKPEPAEVHYLEKAGF